MHFAIPDTSERLGAKSSVYTVYNLHVNGVFHCSIRYSELEKFNTRIRLEFPDKTFPKFPPKKLMTLTAEQVEERRHGLELFMQAVGEDPIIIKSATFRSFLVESQEEMRQKSTLVEFPIRLPDGEKTTLQTQSLDRTERVLALLCDKTGIARSVCHLFGLFIEVDSTDKPKECEGDEPAKPARFIMRRVQNFESPYLAFSKTSTRNGELVVRSIFWNPEHLQTIFSDEKATEWVYYQTVADANNGWIAPPDDVLKELKALKKSKKHKEFLQVISKVDSFGCVQFDPCVCDYPAPNTKVIVRIGASDMSVREESQALSEAFSFKIRRTRCWKLSAKEEGIEFSFDYLFGKNELKWVRIVSSQTIYMSMCVQSVVEELIEKINPSAKKAVPDYGPAYAPVAMPTKTVTVPSSFEAKKEKAAPAAAATSSSSSSSSTTTTPSTESTSKGSSSKPSASTSTSASSSTPSSPAPVSSTTAAPAASSSSSSSKRSSTIESSAPPSLPTSTTQAAKRQSVADTSSAPSTPTAATPSSSSSAPADLDEDDEDDDNANEDDEDEDDKVASAAKPATPATSAAASANRPSLARSTSSSGSSSSSSTSSPRTSSSKITTTSDSGKGKKKMSMGNVFKTLKPGKTQVIDNAMYDGAIGDEDL